MIACAFPGQGVQKVGMVSDLYASQRRYFETASEILGYDLLQLCQEGPQEKLSSTQFAQPAVMVACIASWSEYIMTATPSILLGHSLGLVTAFIAAGAVEFSDGVRIVARRGELMHDAPVPGQMTAILGLELDAVQEIVEEAGSRGTVAVANYNCPGQFVLSGETGAVEYAGELALKKGAKRAVKLDVSGPFHSSLMQGPAEHFARFLEQFRFADPKYPVISNINSRLITSAEQVKMELVAQLTNPVDWIGNIQALEQLGGTQLVEIGPGSVLTGLTKRITKNLELISFA